MRTEDLAPTRDGLERRSPITVVGRRVGRLAVVDALGSGGMGEVYRAYDETLERYVALKAIRRQRLASDAVRERFLREARILSRLSHPNICQIHDLIEEEGSLFLVLELIEGRTLAELLEDRIPKAEALRIASAVAEVLRVAHAKGIVHRDLKPSNVMLTDSGEVKVLDFGIARLVEAGGETADEGGLSGTKERRESGSWSSVPVTATGSVVGTPMYMSPEQAAGEAATPATDLYAFGLLLQYLLTGQPPRPAGLSKKRMLVRAAMGLTEPLAGLPRSESSLIRALLDGDPEKRPAASETLKRLRRLGQRRKIRLGALAATLSFAAVVALLWSLREAPVARLEALRPTQVSFRPGLEVYPAFSPDGGHIAFAADTESGFEIFVKDVGSENAEVQVTHDSAGYVEPDYSPDGASLALTSLGRGSIWRLPATGGPAERLTDFGAAPAWSPDGRSIAFQSLPPSDGGLHPNALPAEPPSTIWLIDVATRVTEPLTTAGTPPGGHGEPCWLPGGRSLLFTSSDRSGSQLYRLDLATRAVEPVELDRYNVFSPQVTPDGQTLLFVAQSYSEVPGLGQSYGLWSLDWTSSGALPRLLARLDPSSIRHLAVDPAGSRVAYSAQTLSSNLWSLALDDAGRPAGDPVAMTTGTGRASRPVFSPDGRRLALERWAQGRTSRVWVMDLTSGESVPVREEGATQASWFADGRLLTFSGAGGPEERRRWLGIVSDLAQGTSATWVEFDRRTPWTVLSPRRPWIAYHAPGADGPVNVWIRDVGADSDKQLTFDRERASYPIWSRDGRWLAYEANRGDDNQLAIVPAEGGEATILTAGPGQRWPFSWDPASRRIAFAHFDPAVGGWSLEWLDRTDGRIQPLTPLTGRHQYVRYPAWSPDGRRIVYERAETTGDIWTLDLERTTGPGP